MEQSKSKWSLKVKLAFLFGLFSIIACVVVATGLSISTKSSLLELQKSSITAVRDSKIEAIQILFERYKQDTESIAVSKYFQDAIVAMESVAHGTGVDLKNDSDLATSIYYKPVASKYTEVFREYITQYKIQNFYAILNSGTTVAQGLNSDLVGKNAISGNLKDSTFGKCFASAKANPGKVHFEDLAVLQTGHPPTVLVCYTIASKFERDGYAKDAIMGVLAVELDWEQAIKIVKNVQGLGSAGQMYILAEDYSSRIASDILQPHSSEVIKASAEVAGGGVVVATNEAGTSVMSGIKKINLQGLNWFVFADAPMSEILSPVYSLYKLTFLIGLLISLILAAVGYYIANTISVRLEADAMKLDKKASELLEMAGQLAAASETLASSATQQAASLEENVATLEEISAIVKQNTVSTNSAATESNASKNR